MVQPSSVNPIWIRLIKILSPILIIGAIFIDLSVAYQWSQSVIIPKLLIVLGAVGSVALVAHGFEGILAGFMAKKRGLNPLRYGFYTFLVGTVGFIDLLEMDE